MEIKMDVTVLVPAVWHGITVDIPDHISPDDKEAVLKWARKNLGVIDYAKPEWSETLSAREVMDVDVYE